MNTIYIYDLCVRAGEREQRKGEAKYCKKLVKYMLFVSFFP